MKLHFNLTGPKGNSAFCNKYVTGHICLYCLVMLKTLYIFARKELLTHFVL
jgi:hypothetical protein